MSRNSEIANMILKAKYYRLKAKAEKAKRQFETEMGDSKKELIRQMKAEGHSNNRIACRLGLVKEYVDAILTPGVS